MVARIEKKRKEGDNPFTRFFFFPRLSPFFPVRFSMYSACTCSLPGITVAFDSLLPSMSRCSWFWARRDMNESAVEANEADGVGGRIDWMGGRGRLWC